MDAPGRYCALIPQGKGIEALCHLPPRLVQFNSFIWLFLSRILYNKTVILSIKKNKNKKARDRSAKERLV